MGTSTAPCWQGKEVLGFLVFTNPFFLGENHCQWCLEGTCTMANPHYQLPIQVCVFLRQTGVGGFSGWLKYYLGYGQHKLKKMYGVV